MKPGDISDVVGKCYVFFSCVLTNAKENKIKNLTNLILQLLDFAKVVECDRDMKSGHIGHVLAMWKCWCLMAQALKGLHQYCQNSNFMLAHIAHQLQPILIQNKSPPPKFYFFPSII